MKLPVEATLDVKPFQDQKKVRSLLESHGFTVTNLAGGKVRVSGNFEELKEIKIILEQLVSTNTHPSSSSSVKKSASGNSPPDQQGSVQSSEELIVVDVDVFRYAELLRKRELDEALKGHVRMHSQNTGEIITITLSGKNSREAGSKLKHFLSSLKKLLRTQDVLLSDISPKGMDLLKQIKKSGNLSGSNLVRFMGDRVHIIGPSKESFELKQELLFNQRQHSGKPSERDGRKRRGLSLQELPRSDPPKDFQEVSPAPADTASGFSSSNRVPADPHTSGKSSERDGTNKRSLSMCLPFEKKSRKDVRQVPPASGDKAARLSASHKVPADHRHSGSHRLQRSSKTQERTNGQIFPEEEVSPPKQRKNFMHRIRSFFQTSK